MNKRLGLLVTCLACGAGFAGGAGCTKDQGPMPATPAEQRFGALAFPLPEEFLQADDTTEEVRGPIPEAPPGREHFRSYNGPGGLALYLFHWDGAPGRDRGPMAAEEQWEASVCGQKATVSLTKLFFGLEQRVLTAHFSDARGDRYLIYAKTADPKVAPDRERFMALLKAIRCP